MHLALRLWSKFEKLSFLSKGATEKTRKGLGFSVLSILTTFFFFGVFCSVSCSNQGKSGSGGLFDPGVTAEAKAANVDKKSYTNQKRVDTIADENFTPLQDDIGVEQPSPFFFSPAMTSACQSTKCETIFRVGFIALGYRPQITKRPLLQTLKEPTYPGETSGWGKDIARIGCGIDESGWHQFGGESTLSIRNLRLCGVVFFDRGKHELVAEELHFQKVIVVLNGNRGDSLKIRANKLFIYDQVVFRIRGLDSRDESKGSPLFEVHAKSVEIAPGASLRLESFGSNDGN